MSGIPTESRYDIDDPEKIQGRDDLVPGDHNLAEIRLSRALEAIGDVSGRLLLLGAGAGRYARALANSRPDLDVVAGDLSLVAVREAVANGGRPCYLAMDARRLPFVDGSFGAVVFFDLLEHVSQPEVMLGECERVLAPGGIVHLFVPLENQPGTLYRLFRRNRVVPIHRWKRDHVGHIQRFTRDDVVALAWRANLEVVDASYSFHVVGQVHDLVDYWQRERLAGGAGRVPLPAVKVITRGVFLFTWRLAYLEDRLYAGPRFASGLHLTARKRAVPDAGVEQRQLVTSAGGVQGR